MHIDVCLGTIYNVYECTQFTKRRHEGVLQTQHQGSGIQQYKNNWYIDMINVASLSRSTNMQYEKVDTDSETTGVNEFILNFKIKNVTTSVLMNL